MPNRTEAQRETYTLVIPSEPNRAIAEDLRLRGIVKRLLRSYGFRLMSIRTENEAPVPSWEQFRGSTRPRGGEESYERICPALNLWLNDFSRISVLSPGA